MWKILAHLIDSQHAGSITNRAAGHCFIYYDAESPDKRDP
jgi:hypothetical protein